MRHDASPQPNPIRRRTAAILALAMLTPAVVAAGSPPDTPTSSDDPAPPVVAPAPSGIVGHVRTQSGEPLHGIVVLAESLDPGGRAIPELAISTDPAGRFFWELEPGRYRLAFVRDGRRLATREVTVPAEQRTVTVDIVLD
jgi:hypothetical protein